MGVEPTLAALGPQYAGDDRFTASARAHQSRFRLERLGLTSYRDYGNRLTTEHALQGLNFYREWPGLLELVYKRFGRKDTPLYYDMLRSQHIPFNLFGPLALNHDGELARTLIKRVAPDIERIDAIRIEHAPAAGRDALGDNTAFDVYIEYTTSRELKCALGVEIKYTEGPYGYGKRERALMLASDSVYHQLTARSGMYVDNAIPRLRQRDLKQLWRNHLLGSSVALRRFRSVLLFPSGNMHAARAAQAYQGLLLPEHQHKFVSITFEEWLPHARRAAQTRAEIAWLEYLSARYAVPLEMSRDLPTRVPQLIVPIKLCVPEHLRLEYPACVAAAALDWKAMPEETTMDDMLGLAYAMTNGYDVSEILGFGDCGDLGNARAEQYRRSGRYRGTAAELWYCLFFSARGWSVGDWPGRKPDDEKPKFDALYKALVAQLRAEDGSVQRVGDGKTRWLGCASEGGLEQR